MIDDLTARALVPQRHGARALVITIEGVEWLVYEHTADFPGARPTLVFESTETVRRIATFPADWPTLPPDALYALSWGR